MNYKSIFKPLLLSLFICGNICAMEEKQPQKELKDLPLEIAFPIAAQMLKNLPAFVSHLQNRIIMNLPLEPNPAINLTWSPSGEYLAYKDGMSVKIVNAHGQSVATIECNDQPDWLEWSPSGEYLAYDDGMSVKIVDPRSVNQKIYALLQSIANQSQSVERFWQIFFNIVAPKPVPTFSCTIS